MSLCLSNFLEQTAEATDWYLLGAFMNLPPKDLSLIEKQFSSQGPAMQSRTVRCVDRADTQCLVGTYRSSSGEIGETVLAEKNS